MESFAEVCRAAYLEGITPSNLAGHQNETYRKLVSIAKNYFDENRYDEFAAGLLDGQYIVSLWVAHMLLEYGNPPRELITICLEKIEAYSENLLAPDVANEEQEWHKINSSKYRDIPHSL